MKRLVFGLWMAVHSGIWGCGQVTTTPQGTQDSGTGVEGPLSPVSNPPTVTVARAQATGRLGFNLRVAATGEDANGDVTGLFVRLLNNRGEPVPYFDLDWNGLPESAESDLILDEPVEGKQKFTAVVTFPDLMAPPPRVFQVAMALIDREGNRSAESLVDVTFQDTLSQGAACDKDYIDNRCADSLGCRGTPATCQEGVAPTVDRGGFFKSPFGPRILLEGSDLDDDLSQVTIKFFDRYEKPVLLDLDNDGIEESGEFVLDARASCTDGKYFVALQAAPTFEELVYKVTVEPQDSFARKGPTKGYPLTSPPGRGQGQTCDPRGFDACQTDQTCSPGIYGSKNTCIASSFARTKKCEAGTQLTIGSSSGPVTGKFTLQGASLWEPPSGCAANNPTNRPETIVRLKLTQNAKSVTLSTARPGTMVDSIVTVLPACSDAAILYPLGCNDDGFKTTASILTLNNLAAGDYIVVLDSWNPAGGQIELLVDATF